MIKSFFSILCLILTVTFLVAPDVDARGGGRGGDGSRGGGRGGGGRPSAGRSMNRSPSMSRSQARPANSPAANRPQQRPSNLPSRATTPQRGAARNPTKSNVQQFLNNHPTRPTNLPAGNQGLGQGSRFSQSSAARNVQSRRNDIGNQVRQNVQSDRPGIRDAFKGSFWDSHNIRPDYFRPGYNGWKWATAAGMAGWLGWNSSPYYYDYSGYDEYWDGSSSSLYEPSTQTTAPQTTYPAPQTYAVQTQPSVSMPAATTGDDWMSLGVFGVTKEGGTTATPNQYLQLAIKKDGTISGVLYNTTTNQTYEIAGVVDKSTQRAAWTIVGRENAPTMETGIYNLTESEAPARVYFPDNRTQDVMLVRLES